MGPGSIRGSIVNLVNVAIGTGVLSLPYTLTLAGFGLGCFCIMIGGVAAYASIRVLINYA